MNSTRVNELKIDDTFMGFKHILTILLICIASLGIFSQQKIKVNGYIIDQASGEALIGANLFVQELLQGTTSNEYGYYALNLKEGIYTITCSYIGYLSTTKTINLDKNQKLDFQLDMVSNDLQEIVISSKAENAHVSDVEMSVNTLDIGQIKKIPAFLGETEIIRSLQLLPGVNTVGEGASGFNVRGGSIDQNLILLDEAPVYNSSHLFGFFSVFNPDAIKDVKLYKGGIPSRYGGRLSSILDVRMKEGNNRQFEMNGGIGSIFSRLSIEAPIIKEKASFIVAGRRSYIDVLSKPFLEDDLEDSFLNFHDLTAKINYTPNDKDRFFISSYFGRDNFGFGDDFGFRWGNKTVTGRWNHVFSNNIFSNTTIIYSSYDYQLNFGASSNNNFNWDAKINNYIFKPQFTWYYNPEHRIKFGGQMIIYEFEPGNAIAINENENVDFSLQKKYGIESALFIEDEWNPSTKFTINGGMRFSFFNYTGKGTAYLYGESEIGLSKPIIDIQEYDQWESIQRYFNLEPRLSINYTINQANAIKASYMRTAQYLHLISNTDASTPVDTWLPSTNNIAPQTADQVAIGYFKNLKKNQYNLSAELYYKFMHNYIEYIDDANLILNEFIEGELVNGIGRAFGLELFASKNKGKLQGFLSYTLARTERKVEGLFNDKWYPSRFDQTHNISITISYPISKRLELGSNFTYITGTPITSANAKYTIQGYTTPYNTTGSRNNIRIPNYHRLDISATLKGKNHKEKRWGSEWVFSVYNIYDRRNAYSIYFKQKEEVVTPGTIPKTEAIKFSVFGNFIPSITYNFQFK